MFNTELCFATLMEGQTFGSIRKNFGYSRSSSTQFNMLTDTTDITYIANPFLGNHRGGQVFLQLSFTFTFQMRIWRKAWTFVVIFPVSVKRSIKGHHHEFVSTFKMSCNFYSFFLLLLREIQSVLQIFLWI